MGRFLLTGASSACASAFMQRHVWQAGDEIIAQYCRDKTVLETLKQDIPAKMEILQADFSDAASTEAFAETLKKKDFVPTHILHVPAVPIVAERFTEMTWRETERQLHVQCRSLVVILQAVIKKMVKAKQGNIVIGLSSVTLHVPPKYLSGYVAAKYALMGLAKGLASEYASKNIRVNMVSPSMMETKFLRHMHSEIVEQSARQNPLRRNAAPEDVAGLMEYLLSEANTFITGANIPVTGGEIF